jgi:5-bromo-4-chloroindolyl phosphate hydrolysis protein
MKVAFRYAFLLMMSVAVFAQTSATVTTTKTTKKNTTTGQKRTAASPVTSELKLLREALDAQQQQIQQLQSELQKRDAALEQVQQQVKALQFTATQAQTTAQTASTAGEQNAGSLTQVQSTIVDLKTTQASTTAALQRTEKRAADLEQPAQIHYKGITMTPGGYLQLATIYRTHNANSDTSDSYGAIPLDGSVNSHMNEFRFSARASRFSMKAETMLHGLKTMGYAEMDFLGAAPTANETQTNSFNPRLRLAFVNVDLPGGWSVAGGQNWSLIQTTRKGITPLSEFLTLVVDNSYIVGFSYARQPSIRVVKSLGTKTWLGFAVENPETVSNVQCIAGTPAASCNVATLGNIQGLANGPNTTSPNNGFANVLATTTSTTGNPSTDRAPDLVAKLAFEPGWGHFEVKAVGRIFRDRVYPNFQTTSAVPGANVLGATNMTTEGGGGIGAGMILPIVKNKIDFVAQGLGGKGIGRFGTTGGPDVTIRSDGTLIPVKGLQAVAGIETHPTPKLDFDIYGGNEYYGRTTYTSTTPLFGATAKATNTPVTLGYGAPSFINSGCALEAPTATQLCQSLSQNRNEWTVTPVLWYRLFKGKEGTLQYGMSYSYIHRKTWAGIGGNPTGIQNIIMTSFRYYLP